MGRPLSLIKSQENMGSFHGSQLPKIQVSLGSGVLPREHKLADKKKLGTSLLQFILFPSVVVSY